MKKLFIMLFVIFTVNTLILCAAAAESTTVVYRNDFDNASSLDEFSQYGGKWEVKNGRLYLTSGTNNHAFILYTGDEELTTLTDYVIDVDMYNVRTQAGIIVRSDLNNITSGSNGFAGYFAFISFTGKKGAIGFANKAGGWGGNLEVSEEITSPGSYLHLQVIVRGNEIKYTVTDIASDTVVWQHTETHSSHTSGTFGFRMSAMLYDGMANIGATSFDNLVVSKFDDEDIAYDEPCDDENLQEEDFELFSDTESKMLSVIMLAQMLGANVEFDTASATITVKFPIEDFNTPIAYEDLMNNLFTSRFNSF